MSCVQVRLYWAGDRKWYAGRVVSFSRGVHRLQYDDGINKWHRLGEGLGEERWELLP